MRKLREWVTPTSVYGRLSRAFVVMIVVAAAIAAVIFASMLHINRRAFAMLDRHENFNLYYTQLDEVQNALFNAQATGQPEEMTQCRQEGAALATYALQLEADYPLRQVVDLRHMTESYLERVEETLAGRERSLSGDSLQLYEDTKYLRDLIFERYSMVYKKTQDANQAQATALRRSQRLLSQGLILSLLVLTLGGLVFARRFARRFVRPILALDESAQQISDGRFDMPALPVPSGDEMGRLTATFNEMAQRLAELVDHYREKLEMERRLKKEEVIRLRTQTRLRDSELKLMQARINPHFLFNTLNMVSQSAYLENADDTVEITNKLASLLRYSLDNLNRVVTLADELENIKDYLYIQKRRFEDRIAFHMPGQTNMLQARLPSMILQPLVENSIIHGLQNDQEDALLGIDIDGGPDRVCIRVYDNGRGLAEDRVRELNHLAAHPSEEAGASIGINNVAARLSLFFAGAYRMEYASILGTYTEVVIEFPVLWEVPGDVSAVDD